MPYLVNGQLVPEELVRQESQRIERDLRWNTIADESERAQRLRAAAEQSAIDRIILGQAAVNDPRPADRQAVEQEMKRQKASAGYGSAIDEGFLRQQIDYQFRLQRTISEMAAGAAKPASEDVKAFYEANRDNFSSPELFAAAHIVKHVNHEQTEEQARAGIEAALADLESGQPFAEVAERHSDCKGKGGDLGQFAAGTMVEEFEQAIRALEPGQRTGVFRTPFGFHIAELRAKTAPGPANFADVRRDIERSMIMWNEHQAYLRALEALRSRADIRLISDAEAAAGCSNPSPGSPAANCTRV